MADVMALPAKLRESRGEIVLLAAVLLLAAALRLWRLDDNGFGTEYYAAAVRSMLQSLHTFLYGSFDPAGFVSIDKPPLAFWIQTTFAAVLGFDGWVIHLPQALAGIASVALSYILVRRYFGIAAALLAAAAFAIAPIAIGIDRSNNTDSLLVFFLLLAAWAALRGSGPSLVGSMILLGLAFNVKMLAALICGPALLAAWLLASRLSWPQRIAWAAAGGAALLIVALSWAVMFDLTPKDRRPYAGSSTHNSMLELIVVHNGLQRFVLDRPTAAPAADPAQPYALYDAVPVGPLRLANPNLAGQFAWFLPLAIGGAVMAWRRHRASAALWGGWALSYGIVYSAAGGIFHIYYLAALVPPLAALCGIGAAELYRYDRRWLALALGVTALWQGLIVGGHLDWSMAWLAAPAVGLLAALAIWRSQLIAPAICGVALAVLPAAWALSAILAPGNFMLPSASLARWLGLDDGRGPMLSRNYPQATDDARLRDYLQANRGTARFAVAGFGAPTVAPFIVRTGQPALAVGGFSGADPILTVEQLAAMVGRGELRFVLLRIVRAPAVSAAAAPPAARPNQELARWVRANGKRVDGALWSSQSPAQRQFVLYDLQR